MKLLSMTFIAAVTGTATLAHSGAHLHPHGIDTSIIVLTAAALAVVAFALIRK